jgi:sialic acid synthase SpsE
MSDLSDWNVCLEIGINHLGSYSRLENIIKGSGIAELGISITVQIKEEDFYKTNKNFYLSLDEHRRFIELCRSMKIPCGLALGPISDLQVLVDGHLEPDFIKTLSISTNNLDFMSRLYTAYDCPKYISVGLSEMSFIQQKIIPLMSDVDMLSHTCLTHNYSDQNLKDIAALKNLKVPVCFGLHAKDFEVAYAAIGAGAEKIFLYIGDKSLDLPDYEHAVDITQVDKIVRTANKCFSAMKLSNGSKKSEIKFIG